MNNYLFVYGTLMQNQDNYYAQLLEKNSELIGKGFIYAKKYDLGDYPGIKICIAKTHKTIGEIYEIKSRFNQIITELDFYEGYNLQNLKESLFMRKEVTVFTKENDQYSAWVYEYAKSV